MEYNEEFEDGLFIGKGSYWSGYVTFVTPPVGPDLQSGPFSWRFCNPVCRTFNPRWSGFVIRSFEL